MKIFRTIACIFTGLFLYQSAFAYAASSRLRLVATNSETAISSRQSAQASRRATANLRNQKRLKQRLARRTTSSDATLSPDVIRTARVTCSLKFEKTEQGVKKLLEGITKRFLKILGAKGKALLAEPYFIAPNTATNSNIFPFVGGSRLDLSLYIRDDDMEQQIQDEVFGNGCTITWQ